MENTLTYISNMSLMADTLQASSAQMTRVATQRNLQEMSTNLSNQAAMYRNLQEQYNKLYREFNDLQKKYENLLSCYKKKDDTLKYHAGRLFVKLLNRPSRDDLKNKQIYKNEAVFNTELVVIEKHVNFPNIPRIVVECIELIEKNPEFMATVGLYRVSGSYTTIQNLRYDINANDYKTLRREKDPHTIIGVLKLFLRELSTPLITLRHLNEHIPDGKEFATEESEQKIQRLQTLVFNLPPYNRATLNYLIKHLVKVAKTIENEMTTAYLSIVFSNSIFFESEQVAPKNVQEAVESSKLPTLCIQEMIENYDQVFENLEMVGVERTN